MCAVRHDVPRARLQRQASEQVGKLDPFPDIIQLAPGGHAVKIGLHSGQRKERARREFCVSVASFLCDETKDAQAPGFGIKRWHWPDM
jgi:hypothetical protein